MAEVHVCRPVEVLLLHEDSLQCELETGASCGTDVLCIACNDVGTWQRREVEQVLGGAYIVVEAT